MNRSLLLPLLAALFLPVFLAVAQKDSEAEKTGRFEPVELEMEGWTISVDPALLEGGAHAEEGEKALRMLAGHLQRVAILVPEEPLAELKKVGIWIEHQHPELGGMQYHPSAKWLENHGHDPRLAKKVHIPKAARLLSREQLLKHPAVVLHELAHGYHDQFLGFDHKEIIAAYDSAMEKGILEKVLLYDGREVKHYAATNHKEYFAETTEAYLYKNDFYPFVAAELKTADPEGFALMKKIWGPAAVR